MTLKPDFLRGLRTRLMDQAVAKLVSQIFDMTRTAWMLLAIPESVPLALTVRFAAPFLAAGRDCRSIARTGQIADKQALCPPWQHFSKDGTAVPDIPVTGDRG